MHPCSGARGGAAASRPCAISPGCSPGQPFPLLYARLDDPDAAVDDLAAIVACQVERHQPGAVVVTEPGKYGVLAALQVA
jgi:hypothetical protein